MATKGGFTLPGESGYEALTLRLAEKWGADCIRDSDGTQLSPEILESGVPIYSTICLVRSVNQWAKAHPNRLQRNFLLTEPRLAAGAEMEIDPLDGYSRQQFAICPEDDPAAFWQVYDRTSGNEHADWTWDGQKVHISGCVPGHLYTVSFLATRIWEEISMYNHITNNWGDREHLMAVEPRYPDTQEALLSFLEEWLKEHPHTSVVRFTSMFYNFTWIWGDEAEKRDVFSDWGSYDFTVNPVSLREFEKEYGYKMTAEDFLRAGKHNPVHNPPTGKMLDWMEFTGRFVRSFGKKCVDLVHKYGKKAYVFYDDTWVGIEPWSGHFAEFGFDGLIKCVFNAFEARLCAGVEGVETHELRLHPYLFPTGLGGEPTFLPGGHPDRDAKRFWACVRRALLRVRIDRIGLGGYLHLTEPFPAFQDEIERIADEFRMLRAFQQQEKPWTTGIRVGILQSWGSLRTWNCSGHMHEHPELPLNHIHEALAGLPVELKSVRLSDVRDNGVPEDVDVLINAGTAGDAWSGGDIWKEEKLREALNRFVAKGGPLLGVREPSAARDGMRYFQTADILGVDREIGDTICCGKYAFHKKENHFITKDMKETPRFHNAAGGVYALSGKTQVLAADGANVVVAANEFGSGRAAYLNGFTYSAENARLLYRALLWAAKREDLENEFMPENPACECAYFAGSGKLVVINNSEEDVETAIPTPKGKVKAKIASQGIFVAEI